ncbi:MAG: tRNA dihydrouridine synthase [Thermodesulfobacteriota bacterium]
MKATTSCPPATPTAAGIPFQLILAPIRGITDWVYRSVFQRHFQGFDLAVAPFIATVPSSRFAPRLLKDVLPENNRGMRIIPQLLGKTPADFIRMARCLHDLGHETVNWNLGCPYPMVARKGRGSGLLPFPEKIQVFLDHVVPAIPNRLSVKTRLGREEPGEIRQVLGVLNQFPLTDLIVHPRTGIQMYTGTIHRDMFRWCLENSRHPVIYNGDITDTRTFGELRRLFPDVGTFMIGRGALADPFLPAELRGLKPPTPPEKVAALKRFHDDLLAAYTPLFSGPAHLTDRMKAHWQYWAASFADGAKLLKAVRKTRHVDAYRITIEQLFSRGLTWKSG